MGRTGTRIPVREGYFSMLKILLTGEAVVMGTHTPEALVPDHEADGLNTNPLPILKKLL